MNKTINLVIISLLMVCIFFNVIPASKIVNAQMLFPNEAATTSTKQSVVLSNNNNNHPSLEEFETFLQFMNYYMSIYGPNWSTQVLKIYENDNHHHKDGSNHKHHDNNDNNNHRDWKKWFDNNRHHNNDGSNNDKNHKKDWW